MHKEELSQELRELLLKRLKMHRKPQKEYLEFFGLTEEFMQRCLEEQEIFDHSWSGGSDVMQKQITVQQLIWDLVTNYKPTNKVEYRIEGAVTGLVELRGCRVEEVQVSVDKTVTEPNLCGSDGRAIISLFVG